MTKKPKIDVIIIDNLPSEVLANKEAAALGLNIVITAIDSDCPDDVDLLSKIYDDEELSEVIEHTNNPEW